MIAGGVLHTPTTTGEESEFRLGRRELIAQLAARAGLRVVEEGDDVTEDILESLEETPVFDPNARFRRMTEAYGLSPDATIEQILAERARRFAAAGLRDPGF